MKITTGVILFLLPYIFGCSPTHNILNIEPNDFKLPPLLILGDTTRHSISTEDSTSVRDSIKYDVEPSVLHQANPVYPPLELALGKEADVFVKVWVTKEGKARQAIVFKSSDMQFNRAAAEAAMRYEFKPAVLKGKPVAVWVYIPFRFRLK